MSRDAGRALETDAAAAPVAKGRRDAVSAWLGSLQASVRRPLLVAMTIPLLGGLLLLPQAWALARTLHLLVIDRQPLAAAIPWLAMVLGLLVVRAILLWMAEQQAQQLAESVKHAARMALFRHLLSAGVLWSRTRASGSLADVLSSRIESFDGYFARYLPAMTSAAVLPLVFAVVLLGFDWIAALLLVLTVPAIPLFMALVGWGAEAAGREHASALSRLSGMFADRVRGLTTLKLFGRAQQEQAHVVQASEEIRERTMAVLRIAFLSSAVLEFFAALGVAGLAVYFGLSFLGLLDLRATPLTLETALFCLLMAPEVYLPMRQLAVHYHDRANVRAAVAEIDELFDGLPRPVTAQDADAAIVNTPHPRFPQPHSQAFPQSCPQPSSHLPASSRDSSREQAHAGLQFDTQAGAHLLASSRLKAPGWLLDEVTLPIPGREPIRLMGPAEIPAGAWVVLSGPSGSGKSSLLETLAGLRPFEGRIELEGRALDAWQPDELRSRVLLISQRPWLVPGSLADNLRLVCPQASDEHLWQALRAVGLDALVSSLPQRLDTPLGARGHGLSGGQAQRIALARMFLSDAPVLLLDEPTAHLDDATRDRLLAALQDWAEGRTLLVATHDPVLARLAGQQWHIDREGRIHPCAI